MSLREQQKAQTRERIFSSAKALFQEHGYFDTTISDIARDASVSPGSVIGHFESKAKLMTLVALEAMRSRRGSFDIPQFDSPLFRPRAHQFAENVMRGAFADLKMVQALMAYSWIWPAEEETILRENDSMAREIFREHVYGGATDAADYRFIGDFDTSFDLMTAYYAHELRRVPHVGLEPQLAKVKHVINNVFPHKDELNGTAQINAPLYSASSSSPYMSSSDSPK